MSKKFAAHLTVEGDDDDTESSVLVKIRQAIRLRSQTKGKNLKVEFIEVFEHKPKPQQPEWQKG